MSFLILPAMTNEDRLRNITRTYLHFKGDPKMVLPTPLMLLLEAGALALLAQENRQAEAGIRKDQRERLEGKPDAFGQSACSRSNAPGR